jgi:mRNA interferase MazF
VGQFVKGDVVVIPFPFSDLSGSKRRPALVLTDLEGEDIILCQITSKNRGDKYAVSLDTADFASGSLPVASYIRTNKIFTAAKAMILRSAGTLAKAKIDAVIDSLVQLLKAEPETQA